MKPSSETKRLRLGSLPDDSEEEDNDASPAAVANETEPGLLSHEEEQKQAVAKSGKSLEERQKDFKEMLLEREVSKESILSHIHRRRMSSYCTAFLVWFQQTASVPISVLHYTFPYLLFELLVIHCVSTRSQVSAFSTWEKELPKFVFDPRYRLLAVKERKACFESFVCSRAEEERKEKKSKLKEKREQYKALLEAAKLHPK